MTSVFEEVRERVSLADAISFLGLKPTETKGDQLRFSCPACKGTDKRTLSVNLQNGFRCFTGDKKGNDATALVAHCRNIRQREAADMLAEHFLRSSTEPRRPKAGEVKGRSSTPKGAARSPEHPVIEMLGIDPALLESVDGGFDGERIVIPIRDAHGEEIGTVGIATRADQVPLLEFSHSVPVQKQEPDELRKMFRVVS